MLLKKKNLYNYFDINSEEVLEALDSLVEVENEPLNTLVEKLIVSIKADQSENEMYKYDQEVVDLLDVDLVNEFLRQPSNIDVQKQLVDHVTILAAATDNMSGLEMYSPQDLRTVLISGEYLDFIKVIHTLRKSQNSDDRHDYALSVVEQLKLLTTRNTYTFNEVLILYFELQLVWSELETLPAEQQQLLFANYLYKAIIVGVPLRDIVVACLYNTTTASEYILINKDFLDYLNNNKEKILVSLNPFAEKTLSELLLIYKTEFSAIAENSKSLDLIISNIFAKQNNSEKQQQWLSRMLELYFGLQSADLIKKNRGGDNDEEDLYKIDLGLLLVAFLRDNWNLIIEYYSRKTIRVPLINLLKIIAVNVKLTNELDVKKVADFSSTLINSNILPAELELVIFDTTDNQFHWNDSLLKN